MLVYVDTNIIMDFLLDRNDKSCEFFDKVVSCKHSIVISDVVISELRYNDLSLEANNFVLFFEKIMKLSIYRISQEDRIAADSIVASRKTHFNDALHKIAATNQGADILLTRNVRHFRSFDDIDLRTPETI